MKILFILSIGHLDGGAAAVWLNLLDAMKAKGAEVFVVMPQAKDATLTCELEARNIPYWVEFFTWWTTTDKDVHSVAHRARRFVAKRANAKAEQKIAQIIRTHKIDCLVIEDGTIEAGLEAATSLGIPVVWHVHEFLDGEYGVQYFLESPGYVQEKFSKAHQIITVSQAIATDLHKQFPQLDNLSVLHNGISRKHVGINEHVLQKDDVQITMAQRIDANKDQLCCIEAFAQIADEFPQATLQFVGSGKTEDVKKAKQHAQQKPCSARITFCGKRNDMAHVWAQTDIAINCSHTEGCSISAAECMQSGCLHVASDCLGNAELLSDGRGLLFPVGDSNALAQQISWALRNREDACEIAQKGQSWALHEFSQEAFAQHFWQIICESVEASQTSKNVQDKTG